MTANSIQVFTSNHWKEYELIDTGGLEKLERFGKYVLIRPEPQAVWEKSLPEEKWEDLSNARYKRTKGVDPAKTDGFEKGEWSKKPGMPDQWVTAYDRGDLHLKFRLGLTAFGHIGVFPEQAENWNYIYDFLVPHPPALPITASSYRDRLSPTGRGGGVPRILNLFAYTGGASLAAKAAGADVVHVDSVKNVVTWAKEMMECSGLKDIRWVVEDALKFVQREVKRGNHYDGIILDPPAYGRGPEGEKWVLQDSISEMVRLCSRLLEDKNSFFIVSLYSMAFSALIADNLVKSYFGEVGEKEVGELAVPDRSGKMLPLGTVLRFTK